MQPCRRCGRRPAGDTQVVGRGLVRYQVSCPCGWAVRSVAVLEDETHAGQVGVAAVREAVRAAWDEMMREDSARADAERGEVPHA